MEQQEHRGPGRPPKPRPEMREELRADARPSADRDIRTRRGNRSLIHDKFHIDASKIPEGLSLNWKAETVIGKEQTSNMMSYYEDGWRPVDASLIPGLMPEGTIGPVRRDGMLLMERPIELTRQAEAEALREARDQFKSQQVRAGIAPEGHFSRDHKELRSGIKIDHSPMPSEDAMAVPE